MKRIKQFLAGVAIMASVLTWAGLSGAQIYGTQSATGAAAISSTLDASGPVAGLLLIGFTLNLSAAPVASEAFTITLDSNDGAAYDTLLYSRDLSVGSVTDVLYQFEPPVFLEQGDKAIAAWANTNTKTYGLRWIYRRAN